MARLYRIHLWLGPWAWNLRGLRAHCTHPFAKTDAKLTRKLSAILIYVYVTSRPTRSKGQLCIMPLWDDVEDIFLLLGMFWYPFTLDPILLPWPQKSLRPPSIHRMAAPVFITVHTPSFTTTLIHNSVSLFCKCYIQAHLIYLPAKVKSLASLFDKLSEKQRFGCHGKNIGPGWLKYEWKGVIYNLHDSVFQCCLSQWLTQTLSRWRI
jgi:hypothetical protein